jgi:hypothetical protein
MYLIPFLDYKLNCAVTQVNGWMENISYPILIYAML